MARHVDWLLFRGPPFRAICERFSAFLSISSSPSTISKIFSVRGSMQTVAGKEWNSRGRFAGYDLRSDTACFSVQGGYALLAYFGGLFSGAWGSIYAGFFPVVGGSELLEKEQSNWLSRSFSFQPLETIMVFLEEGYSNCAYDLYDASFGMLLMVFYVLFC